MPLARPLPAGALRAERQDDFQTQPDYFRKGEPWIDGVEWLVLEDPSTGLAMYRTGKSTVPAAWWAVRQKTWRRSRRAIRSWPTRIPRPTSPMASTCARICRRSTTCASVAPFRTPLTGRRWWMPCGGPPALSWRARVVSNHRPARRWGDILSVQSAGARAWQKPVFLGVKNAAACDGRVWS